MKSLIDNCNIPTYIKEENVSYEMKESSYYFPSNFFFNFDVASKRLLLYSFYFSTILHNDLLDNVSLL